MYFLHRLSKAFDSSRPKFKQFKSKTLLASRKIYESKDEKDLEVENKIQKNKNKRIKEEDIMSMM